MTKFAELPIPHSLLQDEEEGFEVIRFWIGGGNDHVSLHLPADKKRAVDIDIWGTIAADIVKHAVRALLQENPALDETTVVTQIEKRFSQRLHESLNFTGQLYGETQ